MENYVNKAREAGTDVQIEYCPAYTMTDSRCNYCAYKPR